MQPASQDKGGRGKAFRQPVGWAIRVPHRAGAGITTAWPRQPRRCCRQALDLGGVVGQLLFVPVTEGPQGVERLLRLGFFDLGHGDADVHKHPVADACGVGTVETDQRDEDLAADALHIDLRAQLRGVTDLDH